MITSIDHFLKKRVFPFFGFTYFFSGFSSFDEVLEVAKVVSMEFDCREASGVKRIPEIKQESSNVV